MLTYCPSPPVEAKSLESNGNEMIPYLGSDRYCGQENDFTLYVSVELSNFCIWSECQHTRKVCIFLFQAITLPNFCCCWISRKSHFVFETGIFLSFRIFSST